MGTLGNTFREWVASQAIEGYETRVTDDGRVEIEGPLAEAHVAYYCFEGMPEVVEMGATAAPSGESLFFLHFELTDIERARELFLEMAEVLESVGQRGATRVLLCCTAGMTTSMFAARLEEAARALSLDYAFEALPLEEAKARPGAYRAVMLAPQVGYRRREVAAAFPDAVVFEIPAKVFGAFDAGGALRMLMGLVGDDSLTMPDASDLRIVRDVAINRRVLVVSVVRHPHSATLSWCLYDHFRLLDADRVHKCRLDYEDIADLLGTLHLRGIELASIDAVGIAVPGAVDFGRVSFGRDSLQVVDVERMLRDRFGLTAFVDNNANAAAVGCYVSQDAYDSVVLHTQQVGYLVGGQGIVVNGHLVRGRQGAAGELGALFQRLFLDHGMHLGERARGVRLGNESELDLDVAWSAETMLELLATIFVADVSLIAPDAIFVSYDLVDAMDALRREMARVLPQEQIPDLIHIDDYHDRILVGELTLVLQRLATAST